MTEPRIVYINSCLEDNHEALRDIPLIDRYYFLGFYEQIAIAVNSGLIDKNVAHYMFGYFPLRCWDADNFWDGINRQSYYWSVFKTFVDKMQKLESSNLNRGRLSKLWYALIRRSNFKY